MHDMRWSFILFWLFSSSLGAEPGAGRAAPIWPREIAGYGLTVEDAKNDACKHAVEQLATFLAQQQPPLISWQPTVDYVKRHVLQGAGSPGKDDVLESVPTKSWIYPVKPLDLAALTVLDREAQRAARRQERLQLALQLFGGFALVLAILTGAVHLRNAAVPFLRRLR